MGQHNISSNVNFLQALQQLFCARRILGNTYVSAFYFFGNDMFQDEITPEQNDINKRLFEDQQACLEFEVCAVQGCVTLAANADLFFCQALPACVAHWCVWQSCYHAGFAIDLK